MHILCRRAAMAGTLRGNSPSDARTKNAAAFTILLLNEGINAKVVSERLGHTNISITLDTYSHVLPSMQQEAAGRIDAALFGSDPKAAARQIHD